jgi:hypothetical protein
LDENVRAVTAENKILKAVSLLLLLPLLPLPSFYILIFPFLLSVSDTLPLLFPLSLESTKEDIANTNRDAKTQKKKST